MSTKKKTIVRKDKIRTTDQALLQIVIERLDTIVSLILPKTGTAEKKSIVEKVSEDGRFIDCGDGTIKDTKEITLSDGRKVRLMWQKDGSESIMNLADADKYAKESKVGGYNDWKVPEIDELESLVDRTKYKPAIISDLFNVKTDDWYWSGTEYKGYSDYTWVVYFDHGGVDWDYRGYGNYVRPVRQY